MQQHNTLFLENAGSLNGFQIECIMINKLIYSDMTFAKLNLLKFMSNK